MEKSRSEAREPADEVTVMRRVTNALDSLGEDRDAQERVMTFLNSKYPQLKIAPRPDGEDRT